MSNLLKDRIQEDMKSAMRAKDARRLGVIRLLLAAVKQREIDERISLDDSQVLAVIDKMIKQRHDAIDQFQSAGRNDLAEQEQFEISVLSEYLPPALNDTEIAELLEAAIANSGATSMRDMGKVMGLLKPQLQGRADMGAVSAKIKAALEAKE